MKRFGILSFCLPILWIFPLSSCVRDVIMDADEKPTVVVDCILSDGDTQELRLNFTKGASKTVSDTLTDAVATLIDLTESKIVGVFSRKDGELWTLEYSAVPEHSYRLEVQVPGYDLIYAEDTMPRKIGIHGQTFKLSEIIDEDYRKMHPELFAGLPDEYPNCFHGTCYRFEEDFSGPLWIFGVDYDIETLYEYFWSMRSVYIIEDPIASEIYTDLPNVDDFNITGNTYIPHLIPYDVSITNSGPFPIVGVLTVYPNLKGCMKHDRFLRLEGVKKSDEPFLVDCTFKIFLDKYGLEQGPQRIMVFMQVSDNYDAYLKTSYKMIEIQKLSDMSTIYLRNNVPSNVHGGIGILGCKIEHIKRHEHFYSRIPVEEYYKFGINENHQFISK